MLQVHRGWKTHHGLSNFLLRESVAWDRQVVMEENTILIEEQQRMWHVVPLAKWDRTHKQFFFRWLHNLLSDHLCAPCCRVTCIFTHKQCEQASRAGSAKSTQPTLALLNSALGPCDRTRFLASSEKSNQQRHSSFRKVDARTASSW